MSLCVLNDAYSRGTLWENYITGGNGSRRNLMDNGVEPKWPRCKCGGAAVTNASGDLTRTCIRCGKIVRKDSSVEPIRGDSMDNGVENVSDLRAALAVKTELLDEMAGIADKLQVELAVMREELDTLRHEKEFLIENNVKSMTLYRDELALRTQERDRLKERFSGLASDYLHEDDRFVIKFAIAMSEKLDKKRAEGYDGWRDECTPEFLAKSFLKHISKGDPVDVANFCMMLNYRLGGPRVMKEAFAKLTKERDALAKALEAAKELFELSEDCQEPGTDAYTWLHQAGLLINPPDALTERSKR